jgi:type II secretory pathway component PulF
VRVAIMNKSVYLDIDSGDKAQLCRLLAMCIGNDVPIVEALHAVGDCARNPRLKEATLSMASWIQSGDVLSSPKLFQVYPEFEDGFFRSYVSTGEFTGQLDRCLSQLAERYDGLRKAGPHCSIDESEPLAIFLSVWRDLCTMNLPVLYCLRGCLTVMEERKFPLMAAGIVAAIEAVEQGDMVSQAFRRSPERFPATLAARIYAAEIAGAVDTCLNDILKL